MSILNESLAAVFITALIAFLGLIISKESKISEFRHDWISTLRADLANFNGIVNFMFVEFKLGKLINQDLTFPEIIKSHSEKVSKLAEIKMHIELSLNQSEDTKIINVLDEIYENLQTQSKLQNNKYLDTLLSELQTLSHTLLKKEWKRVKKGEKWFAWSKYGAVIVMFLFSVYFIFDLFQRVDISIPDWWLSIDQVLSGFALGYLLFSKLYEGKEHLVFFIMVATFALSGIAQQLLATLRVYTRK